jgi:hypothetical protein
LLHDLEFSGEGCPTPHVSGGRLWREWRGSIILVESIEDVIEFDRKRSSGRSQLLVIIPVAKLRYLRRVGAEVDEQIVVTREVEPKVLNLRMVQLDLAFLEVPQ